MYCVKNFKKFFFLGILMICGLAAGKLYASSIPAIWPEATGMDVRIDGNLRLDCSNTMDGYVMMSVATPSANAFKVQVTINGNQLIYDLNNQGNYEVLPLQFGTGDYSISLFENVAGSKYASGGQVNLNVPSMYENAAFLVPNQYVNYTVDSPSVKRAEEETAGMSSQSEIFEKVCNIIGSEFSYDFVRAQTIQAGTLPEVDSTYNNRAGICQDLSAVMISMLRSSGVPSRLIIGYADGYYHAWTISVVDGEEKFSIRQMRLAL